MRPLAKLGSAALAATLIAVAPASARADASSWVFLGGGAVGMKDANTVPATTAPETSSVRLRGAMDIDVGVGTSPDGAFILGGLFRISPIFGSGTDLSLVARGATHGFQSGSFGLAFDAGAYARFWGVGSTGFTGAVRLGAPLGLELAVKTMVGTNDALTFGAIAGIDVLRLTVYRQNLLDWWLNPAPAQEHRREARSTRSW